MVLGRYMVEAVVLEGGSPIELARAHGISQSWIYELVARYRAGGYPALEPRSRRPRSCPHQNWHWNAIIGYGGGRSNSTGYSYQLATAATWRVKRASVKPGADQSFVFTDSTDPRHPVGDTRLVCGQGSRFILPAITNGIRGWGACCKGLWCADTARHKLAHRRDRQ
jgi:Helix-turn-helix domain